MSGIKGKKKELYDQWGLGNTHPDLFEYFKMKRVTCSPTNKNRRIDRNGTPIEWKLSGQQLLDLLEDKRLTRDDLRIGKWNLTRKDDLGHYEIDNVELKRHGDNTIEHNKRRDYSFHIGNTYGKLTSKKETQI